MTKRKLILIPGLLCDFRLWQPQIDAFSDLADIIIGDTFKDDSISGMAKRIIDQAEDDDFALAGLSMGGYVAMEIMRQVPDQVRGLALLDTSARGDEDLQKRRRRGLINLASQGKFFGVTPRLLPMLIHPNHMENQELTDLVVGMAAHVGKERFISQQTAIMNRVDSKKDLTAYSCPTLVICGRQDEITPLPLSEEMASAIPGARLHIIEECGHLTSLEKPEEVNQEMKSWFTSL